MRPEILLPLAIGLAAAPAAFPQNADAPAPITREAVVEAAKISGLDFTNREIDLMLPGLSEKRGRYELIRQVELPNSVPPALLFNPIPVGMKLESGRGSFKQSPPGKVRLPDNPEDLAFYSVGELAALVRARKVTSEQLTRLSLERLKKHGPRLECVVTLTEDLALSQARRADAEIAAGKYRGPLHGIPYGAKDLLAKSGHKTTWGAVPYRDQVIEEDAEVIKRLEAAGAVLVAKLTLGELAWGDVWFGGMTRNPWNLKQGSSGSSAGSAAATAAGLVPFAIGSETHGSIVSPSDRCGVTGLRPTYGRVSRAGAMTLSWSMDKIGPIARTVEDCALVLNAIHGPDGVDQTLQDVPFRYDPKVDLRKVRVGYLKGDFENAKINKANNDATLAKLRELGADLVPVDLPNLPTGAISFILSTEAAAAFDDLTRSGRDDMMVRQIANAWPNVFREVRMVPAVEYIQANRIRYLLVQEMAKLFREVDVYLAPSLEGRNTLVSNLTGHPCVVVPNGFSEAGTPASVCFVGNLFDEGRLLAVAKRYQDASGFHRRHPSLE